MFIRFKELKKIFQSDILETFITSNIDISSTVQFIDRKYTRITPILQQLIIDSATIIIINLFSI